MTNEEIIKGNTLICEFMGWEIEKGMAGIDNPFYTNNNGFSISRPSSMGFHSSWDWLMPVCAKINSKESTFTCELNGVKNSITCYINSMREMKKGLIEIDILKTWSGVIFFIEKYNAIISPSIKPTNNE